jgi:hypothetical protein
MSFVWEVNEPGIAADGRGNIHLGEYPIRTCYYNRDGALNVSWPTLFLGGETEPACGPPMDVSGGGRYLFG